MAAGFGIVDQGSGASTRESTTMEPTTRESTSSIHGLGVRFIVLWFVRFQFG